MRIMTIVVAMALVSALSIGAPTNPWEDELPSDVEVEFVLECVPGTSSVEIWVTSYAEHGISCAFVDLSANGPVTGITHGPDYTVLTGGDIVSGGVVNLGGCTLVAGGAGQSPEQSLVATVDFDADNVVSSLDDPSNPSLRTSIYGEGFADGIEYGPARLCITSP